MESVLETYLGGVQTGVAAATVGVVAAAGATAAAAQAYCGTPGAETEDIPKGAGPVWILGREYCAIQGR